MVAVGKTTRHNRKEIVAKPATYVRSAPIVEISQKCAMGRFESTLHNLWSKNLARGYLEVFKLRPLPTTVVAFSAALASLSVRGIGQGTCHYIVIQPHHMVQGIYSKIDFRNKVSTLANRLSKSNARKGVKRLKHVLATKGHLVRKW